MSTTYIAEPSERDISTLRRALQLEQKEGAGIFPRGGAQYARFRKLVRYGMLVDTGEWGRDTDGEVYDDVRIFCLTDDGRKWIKERDEKQGALI